MESTTGAPRPDVSVVIPNLDGGDDLERCIRSLLEPARGIPVEVLVVDNGSTDGSPGRVRGLSSEVTVLENGENLGFAAAVNRGLEVAKGRHLLILNSDAELEPGALERGVEFLDSHPRVGAIGFQLLNPDGSLQPSGRRFPTPASLIGRAWGLGPDEFRDPGRDYGRLAFVDEVSGACVMLRREACEAVGGFDPGYFFYMEDIDLCRRLWQKGWQVVYVPSARAIHQWGRSSRHHSERVRLEGRRSLLRYVAKFHGRGWHRALRLALAPRDLVSLAHWLLRGLTGTGGAVSPAQRIRTVLRTLLETVSHPGLPEPSPILNDPHSWILSRLRPGSRILEIGCGPGRILERAVTERGVEATGVEIDPAAAARATAFCQQVVTGDVMHGAVRDQVSGTFDHVIMADVVEHLTDPDPVLRWARSRLDPGGLLLMSVPNIAHYRHRLALLRGRWEYEDSGPMDRTHVTFYTIDTARRLLVRCGFRIVEEDQVHGFLQRIFRPGTLFQRTIARSLGAAFPQLFGHQLLFAAVPVDAFEE